MIIICIVWSLLIATRNQTQFTYSTATDYCIAEISSGDNERTKVINSGYRDVRVGEGGRGSFSHLPNSQGGGNKRGWIQ